MEYQKALKRAFRPHSLLRLLIPLIAIFALSGLAWASMEFISSGRQHNDGDSPDFAVGYHGGPVAEGSSGNNANAFPENIGSLISTWMLPSGAETDGRGLLVMGSGIGDDDPPSHRHDTSLTHFTAPANDSFRRAAYYPGSNSRFFVPAVAHFSFPISDDSGGGGGGGGGGVTNPNQPFPTISQTQSNATGTINDVPAVTTGDPLPNNGGSQTSTAPVPEPKTYLLLTIGLGLLGFFARRRKEENADFFKVARDCPKKPERASPLHSEIAIWRPLKASER